MNQWIEVAHCQVEPASLKKRLPLVLRLPFQRDLVLQEVYHLLIPAGCNLIFLVLEMLCALILENARLLKLLLCVQLPTLFGFLKLDQGQLVDQCGISLNSQLGTPSSTKSIARLQGNLSYFFLLHLFQRKFNSPWNVNVESLSNLKLKLSLIKSPPIDPAYQLYFHL